MFRSPRFHSRGWRWALAGLLVLSLAGYWLLRLPGKVLLVSDNWQEAYLWPRLSLEPANPRPGQRTTVTVSDTAPWINVKLLVAGKGATFERYVTNEAGGYWTWYWSFTAPAQTSYPAVFYHDCDTGCVERARVVVGAHLPETAAPPDLLPIKLGTVFADLSRNWHGRPGWDVELTYAQQAEADYWNVDDLAARVEALTAKSVRVLVRVDYDKGQSLPPAGDYLALDAYLRYLQRLARDARLKSVYGYIIGSGYNAAGNNALAPDRPITPDWYARVFNGYQAAPSHQDNVVAVIRRENAAARVLVGPVQPWATDQDGSLTYQVNMPWLNYFNTLVAALDASARAKDTVGVPLAAPDGFAVQAPGALAAPELAGRDPATEPQLDLRRPEWHGGRIGFGVYRDWQDIVNSYPRTRGLPVYITSSNTYLPGADVKPAQNYPRGWLRAALTQVNAEPQVQALCWYLDEAPLDKQWELFSLSEPRGLLVEAADEFDQLLAAKP